MQLILIFAAHPANNLSYVEAGFVQKWKISKLLNILLHLSKLAFIYQFYTRITVLLELIFWNPAELFTCISQSFQNISTKPRRGLRGWLAVLCSTACRRVVVVVATKYALAILGVSQNKRHILPQNLYFLYILQNRISPITVFFLFWWILFEIWKLFMA